MVKLMLDARDENDVEMEGHVRKLMYPPVCIVVAVDNVSFLYLRDVEYWRCYSRHKAYAWCPSQLPKP